MKDFLNKLIANKTKEADELRAKIAAGTDVDEVRALGETLQNVLDELNEAKKQLDDMDKQEDAPADEGTNDQGEEAASRSFNPMASYSQRGAEKMTNKETDKDVRSSIEYRTAFMNYVRSGERTAILESRADDQSEVSDLGVLLPTTVVNEIIKGAEKVYGQLYAKVKKTNLKGGVKYPLGSFSATFNRITENGAPTDRQNGGSVTGYVEFGYKIGEIRLAQTLLMTVMGVEVFEQELAKIIVEAYVEAMDKEIMSGVAANNQCEGILTEAAKVTSRIPSANIIEFTATDMADWTTWQTKLFAKIPLSMRSLSPEFVMTANTFEANIETLKDSNNQPVARNIYNPQTGAETATFKGKQVTFVEDDVLENFNDATNGEYFGMYWVPDKAYAINSNLEFAVTRYFDNEKNQYVQKGLVINDGKVLDPKYIYLFKKTVSI